MVLGWRRAFCTSIPKDTTDSTDGSATEVKTTTTPRPISKFNFFSGSGSGSSPSLRCRTTAGAGVTTNKKPGFGGSEAVSESPRLLSSSSSGASSPRTPSSFSLLKSTLRHSLSAKKEKPTKELSSGELRDVKVRALRVYDDDEPIMSPISGARFNPIPELEENDEEIEFQGFSPELARRSGLAGIEVGLSPEAAVLAAGRGYETRVVAMTVKGPPANGGCRRAPVDLVAVLEVTGAMAGEKLKALKRTMSLIISTLSDSDRLSVVAFSAASKRLVPLRRMTASNRRSARRVVDALGSAGKGMCVADALKKAAKVLGDRRQRNSAASIILLSDGHGRPGPTVTSTRFSNTDIPVHALAITGGGACDHAPPTTERLESLLTVAVKEVELQIRFASGSGHEKVVAVYSVSGQPAVLGSGTVKIGDLFSEEERELLIELKFPTSSTGSHHSLAVRSYHVDPSSGVHVHTKEQTLTLPPPQTVRSGSPSIRRLRNLHVTVRAVAESRRLIEHGEFSGAERLLGSARALLAKSSPGSAEEFLRFLAAEQAKLHRLKKTERAEPLTPTSAWRAAETLAKVAIKRKSLNKVSDLHGFENARF